jgi:hypothetical protein
MAKVRPVKPRPKKSEAPVRKQPAAVARRSAEAKARQKQAAAPVAPVEPELHAEIDPEDDESMSAADRGALCRSCGKRPGRPTAILGQMTQAELCPQCTALRKERIRLNRAAARGMRSSRLF